MQATTEQLLAVLAQEIGELKVNQHWLTLQLNAANEQLAASELEREAMTSRVLGMEGERAALVSKLAELEPPPPAGPTPRAKTASRR